MPESNLLRVTAGCGHALVLRGRGVDAIDWADTHRANCYRPSDGTITVRELDAVLTEVGDA